MELVKTLQQIRANVEILEEARQGMRRGEGDDYLRLIKRGTCFLPYQTGNGLAFAPSRFIGYVGNSFAKHAANAQRDGRLTNRAINAILECAPVADAQLESQYRQFCALVGIAPSTNGTFGIARKYWVLPELRDRLELLAETKLLENPALSETEKAQLIKARVGQGAFRDALMAQWNSQCCVTNCAIKPVLRASHIKPWRVSTNAERLDPFNGLLLTANIDILFDRGLISFSDDGNLLRSRTLDLATIVALGCQIDRPLALSERHAPYLAWHRDNTFDRD